MQVRERKSTHGPVIGPPSLEATQTVERVGAKVLKFPVRIAGWG